MTEYLVEGWTERIIETLKANGVAQNLTGLTVGIQIYDCDGNLVTPVGTVGVVSAAAGTVYFDPGPTDLVNSKSPYSVRWKVTDGAGKVAYWPAGVDDAPVKWNVDKP